MRKLKQFSGKAKQIILIGLNLKSGMKSILENSFEGNYSPKMNELSVPKWQFLLFWKFLWNKV